MSDTHEHVPGPEPREPRDISILWPTLLLLAGIIGLIVGLVAHGGTGMVLGTLAIIAGVTWIYLGFGGKWPKDRHDNPAMDGLEPRRWRRRRDDDDNSNHPQVLEG